MIIESTITGGFMKRNLILTGLTIKGSVEY